MESMSQERVANLTVGSEEKVETKIDGLTKRKLIKENYKRGTDENAKVREVAFDMLQSFGRNWK